MKYENFELINSKVAEIKKLGSLLNELTNPNLEVRINYAPNRYTILVISDPNDEYSDKGRALIDDIGKDVFDRINKLKAELESL